MVLICVKWACYRSVTSVTMVCIFVDVNDFSSVVAGGCVNTSFSFSLYGSYLSIYIISGSS